MFRQILICAALAALTALLIAATACICVIARTVEKLPVQLEDQIIISRNQALDEIAATRKELLAHLDKLEARADSRLGGIQRDARLELAATRELVAHELDANLARVDDALGVIYKSQSDLAPILAHVTQITLHADEASAILFRRDALPAQVLGVLGATKVTMGETAQAMKVIRDSAPQVSLSTIATAKSIEGIAADVHQVTSAYLKPRTFWGKVWGGVKSGAIIWAHTL